MSITNDNLNYLLDEYFCNRHKNYLSTYELNSKIISKFIIDTDIDNIDTLISEKSIDYYEKYDMNKNYKDVFKYDYGKGLRTYRWIIYNLKNKQMYITTDEIIDDEKLKILRPFCQCKLHYMVRSISLSLNDNQINQTNQVNQVNQVNQLINSSCGSNSSYEYVLTLINSFIGYSDKYNNLKKLYDDNSFAVFVCPCCAGCLYTNMYQSNVVYSTIKYFDEHFSIENMKKYCQCAYCTSYIINKLPFNILTPETCGCLKIKGNINNSVADLTQKYMINNGL
jgi:hypothetical protein